MYYYTSDYVLSLLKSRLKDISIVIRFKPELFQTIGMYVFLEPFQINDIFVSYIGHVTLLTNIQSSTLLLPSYLSRLGVEGPFANRKWLIIYKCF